MAQSKALRDALESFKKSENSSWRMPIVFTKEYYLNSVASPIYINPVERWILRDCLLKLCSLKIFKKNQD
jgi:hypothetical protein